MEVVYIYIDEKYAVKLSHCSNKRLAAKNFLYQLLTADLKLRVYLDPPCDPEDLPHVRTLNIDEKRELLEGVAPQESSCVPEEGKAHPLLGQFLPGPAGMVGPMEEGLRVGHQAEDPSRRIADPRDAVYGAVGIRGILQR